MEEQRLLKYAKDQQSKNEDHYRKLVQDYITQLDKCKAKKLAELQKELERYREKIFQISQVKLSTVNEQANSIKGKILREEQQIASRKIDSTMSQLMQIFNDEKAHHLGSESITRTQILSTANVGTKASGQHCQFNFDQLEPPKTSNHQPDERAHRKSKNQ